MSENLHALAESISQQYLNETPAHYIKYAELADPTKLDILFDATSAGLNPTSACEAAGIHTNTWNRWLKRAEEEPESAYGAFSREIKRLRRQGQIQLLGRIKKASELPQHWTAAAWTLERTDPEQFALRKDDAQVQKVVVQVGVSATDVRVIVSTKTGSETEHSTIESHAVTSESASR